MQNVPKTSLSAIHINETEVNQLFPRGRLFVPPSCYRQFIPITFMLFLLRDLFYPFSSDVNECQSLKDNCHAKAECVNTLGSFECRCKLGYLGDGVNCTCEWQ